MASKVPKFGAWEGGENFTVYFDNARKTKTGGQMINPNDPEENPDLFRLNGYTAQAQAQGQAQVAPAQARADQQRKHTKVPHFGAWENEETAGYTVCFENVRNTRNGGPPVAENEPQMNRDMPHRPGPSAQAQAHAHGQGHGQAQAHAVRTRPETRGGRPKVPEFGDWESDRGDGYTQAFDLLKKGRDHPKPNAPQSNRDVGPAPQEGRAKVPKFGDWEDGEGVQYTTYFEKAKDSRNLRPGGLYSNETQMNRDVGDSDAGSHAGSSVSGSERQSRQPSVAQAPSHPRANLQHRNGPTRGIQAGSIPQFGGWNNDPSQAKEYTDAFTRGKDDRHAPVNYNVPPPYQRRQPHPQPQPQPQPKPQPKRQAQHQRQPHSSKQKQSGCCTIM